MFYCDQCRTERDLPDTLLVRSTGPCEFCGNVRRCNDTPSRLLDDPIAYAATEASLRARGAGEALDLIRADDPGAEGAIADVARGWM